MKLFNILYESQNTKLEIRLVNKQVSPGSEEDYTPDQTTYFYDVFENGTKIGELRQDDYFGFLNGHLWNKELPNDISGYDKGGNGPQADVNAFLASKSGQRWMSNIDKYRNLEKPTGDYRRK